MDLVSKITDWYSKKSSLLQLLLLSITPILISIILLSLWYISGTLATLIQFILNMFIFPAFLVFGYYKLIKSKNILIFLLYLVFILFVIVACDLIHTFNYNFSSFNYNPIKDGFGYLFNGDVATVALNRLEIIVSISLTFLCMLFAYINKFIKIA